MGDFSYTIRAARRLARDIAKQIVVQSPRGGIFFVAGPTRAGKTLTAILLSNWLDRYHVPYTVAHPQSERDDIVSGKLVSRYGGEIAAKGYRSAKDIRTVFSDAKIVIIDEPQFTHLPIQSLLLQEAIRFKNGGGWCVFTGLLYTSARGKFPLSEQLVTLSDHLYQMYATCSVCGNHKAKYSQRLLHGKPVSSKSSQLMPPSSSVSYEPRCEQCHIP